MTEVLNRALLNAPHMLDALCVFSGISGGVSELLVSRVSGVISPSAAN